MNSNLAYKLELTEEIIGGQVMMLAAPSSNHNRVSTRICSIFDHYLDGRPCEPFGDHEAVYLEEDQEEYQPDMMVVCDPEKVRGKGVFGAPDLVVEVLSASTARYDRGHKKDVYERHGVREYWIVDPEGQNVEQYLLQDGRFVLRDVYHRYSVSELEDMKEKERAEVVTEFPCGIFPDLTISLDRIFRRVQRY